MPLTQTASPAPVDSALVAHVADSIERINLRNGHRGDDYDTAERAAYLLRCIPSLLASVSDYAVWKLSDAQLDAIVVVAHYRSEF